MRRVFVPAALASAFCFAATPATAAALFDASARLSITLKRADGGASASFGATVAEVGAIATGDFGTFANAFPSGTLFDDGPLAADETVTVRARADGATSASPTQPNTASAIHDWDRAFVVTGAAGSGGTVVFEGVYGLSALATLDSPGFETAFAKARIAVGSLSVLIDTLNGGGPLVDVPFSFSADVEAGEVKTVAIDVFASGVSTAAPSPAPLPAAAPLLLAGLGALGLASRRRRG